MMRDFLFTDKIVFLSLFLIFAPFGGCAYFQKSEEVKIEIPQENNIDNYEILVKESRAEADRLRSELATMKIAAAKNTGDLQFTQGARSNPRNQEEELASEIQNLKADILKLEEERDQLRHQNVQLQARSEALPGMRQLVMDIKALQTSVHQLVTKMETLSIEIIKIKQDSLQNEKRHSTQPPKLTALPATSPSDSSPDHTKITVEWGDTLWEIAHAHGISVKELKEMNGLITDSISVDQQLEVPLPHPQPSELDTQAAMATKKSEKESNDVTDNEGAQNAKEGP
jgi:LysM repeat protein